MGVLQERGPVFTEAVDEVRRQQRRDLEELVGVYEAADGQKPVNHRSRIIHMESACKLHVVEMTGHGLLHKGLTAAD